MKEMKKMIFACMSAFLLVGSMFIMPLNTVSASASFEVKENVVGSWQAFVRKDNHNREWKAEYKVDAKTNGTCSLYVRVKHSYEKWVKKARVTVLFKDGTTASTNVSGMKPKNEWEQWTWANEAKYCVLKNLKVDRVEVNK